MQNFVSSFLLLLLDCDTHKPENLFYTTIIFSRERDFWTQLFCVSLFFWCFDVIFFSLSTSAWRSLYSKTIWFGLNFSLLLWLLPWRYFPFIFLRSWNPTNMRAALCYLKKFDWGTVLFWFVEPYLLVHASFVLLQTIINTTNH